MPVRPKRPCKAPGCRELTDGGYCATHQAVKDTKARQADRERGTAHQRGYNARWRKYRESFLGAHPLCECEDCRSSKVLKAATVVDHIVPHRGDYDLFWDRSNHQAMSKECHDRKTATVDGGFGRY